MLIIVQPGTVGHGNFTFGARLKKDRQGRKKTVKGEKRPSRAIKDPQAENRTRALKRAQPLRHVTVNH